MFQYGTSFFCDLFLKFDSHKVPDMPHVEGIQHFYMSAIAGPGLSSEQYRVVRTVILYTLIFVVVILKESDGFEVTACII